MKMKELSEQPDETPMVLFQSDDGAVRLNVRLEGETVWLPQRLMALLFDCSTDNISLHLRNIFAEGELNENSVTEDFSVTAADAKKYRTRHYNLDVIIAVGYRVNSRRATQFRIWATSVLKEYIVKGFALNDERMKTGRNMTYFDELQERIREIRISERVFYQKIKDIYTTSVDYDSRSEATLTFFKIVQNKLLWAISLQTAAELVARRANADLPFMGMKSCDKKDEKRLTRHDAVTAKNYLSEDEMKSLGLLVEQYLAFAEAQAHRQVAMTMQDWILKLDAILTLNGRELLTHAGSINHQLAEEVSALQLDKFRERLGKHEHDTSLEELERDLNARKKKRGGKK